MIHCVSDSAFHGTNCHPPQDERRHKNHIFKSATKSLRDLDTENGSRLVFKIKILRQQKTILITGNGNDGTG